MQSLRQRSDLTKRRDFNKKINNQTIKLFHFFCTSKCLLVGIDPSDATSFRAATAHGHKVLHAKQTNKKEEKWEKKPPQNRKLNKQKKSPPRQAPVFQDMLRQF